MIDSVQQRADRFNRLYASNKPGDLMVVVRQNPYWVSKKNLFDYDFDRGQHIDMAEDMAQCAETMIEASERAGDDLIPWMSPDFGIAIHHSHVIDGHVEFAEWTSWSEPPLAGENGYKRLAEVTFNADNRWVKRILEMVAYWKSRPTQPYLVNGHGHFSPLDMANALRGNILFTDFYDVPELVTELLDRSTDCIIAFEKALRSATGDRPGMAFWGAMAPKGSVFVSEDTMDLVGPKVAEKWGRPWTERLRDAVGGLAVHHHMLGSKVHSIVGQMAHNSLVQISNDPNCPQAADKVLELYEASGTNALMFDCSLDQLRAIKPILPRIRAVLIVTVGEDIDSAREAVDIVRSASNIS